jgi:hypothetical protein
MNNRISRFFSKGDIHKIEVRLDMIDFVENDTFITYAPALDLSGYGATRDEAHRSFEVVLEEYMKYTINKKTLAADLSKRGWNVSKKHLNPPSLTWLIENNAQVKEVYDSHDFSKHTRPVKVPLTADCA